MKKPKNNDKKTNKRPSLRQRLIAGYVANAEADIILANEWQPVEEECWFNIPD